MSEPTTEQLIAILKSAEYDGVHIKLARLEALATRFVDRRLAAPMTGRTLEEEQAYIAMRAYLNELAAERPTPPTTEDGQ